MKKYTKTHSSETAVNAHSKKIEARGGKVEVNNMDINYSFPNSTPQVNENKIEKPAKISALMREYQSIRKQYPDAVIWFAIGGFVEAFSDSAEITAKVLGIPLVKNKNIEYPLAGF